MQLDWWTLALQAINALVLIWLLQRFLFRPVVDIIASRRAAADRLLAEAKAARDDARAEQARVSEAADAAAAGRAEAMRRAEAEAAASHDALVAEARKEAAGITAAAVAEVERTRAAVAAEVSDRAARLAVEIAARLFQRLPREAQVTGFIDGLAQAVAALPQDAIDGIAPRNGPMHLRAARALAPDEAEACRAALSGAIGRPVEIAVDVDPEVIAGLEAEGPLGVARNSFRADLEKLTEALTSHDATPA